MTRPGSHYPKSAKPRSANCRASGVAMLNSFRALYGDKPAAHISNSWRERLPDPAAYYGQHVAKLGQHKANGYALGLCPFHDDHSPSFGVKLTDARGHWCCYAGCGKGDMLAFHQRLTGLDFKAAVRDLIGGGR